MLLFTAGFYYHVLSATYTINNELNLFNCILKVEYTFFKALKNIVSLKSYCMYHLKRYKFK